MGTDLLYNSNGGVYGAVSPYFFNKAVNEGVSNSDAISDANPNHFYFSLTLSNTTEDDITYRYYFSAAPVSSRYWASKTDMSKNILIYYKELPEPFTVPAGETKTITITLNLDNI